MTADQILVLEVDLEGSRSLQHGAAPQESLAGAAPDIVHLAGEDQPSTLAVDHGRHGIGEALLRITNCAADPDRPAHGTVNGKGLHFAAAARRLGGRRGRTQRRGDHTRQPFHPMPARRTGHDDGVVTHIAERHGKHGKVVDGEARHLGFREGPAHGVGIDNRKVQGGARQKGLDSVAAADLGGHDRLERAAQPVLERPHRRRREFGVRQTLLAGKRRSHGRDHGNEIVIVELSGINEIDCHATAVEGIEIEPAIIGTAATTGAQDPGAGGERRDVVFVKCAHACQVFPRNGYSMMAAQNHE